MTRELTKAEQAPLEVRPDVMAALAAGYRVRINNAGVVTVRGMTGNATRWAVFHPRTNIITCGKLVVDMARRGIAASQPERSRQEQLLATLAELVRIVGEQNNGK